jgi:hypothetical protein
MKNELDYQDNLDNFRGLVLVKDNSKTTIATLDQLKECNKNLIEYGTLCLEQSELASYFRDYFTYHMYGSIHLYPKNNTYSIFFPSANDVANDILRFLSLSKEERKKLIERFRKKTEALTSKQTKKFKYDLLKILQNRINKEGIDKKIELLKQNIRELEALKELLDK